VNAAGKVDVDRVKVPCLGLRVVRERTLTLPARKAADAQIAAEKKAARKAARKGVSR